MWWIIGLVIAGIFGIAQAILDSLRKEVSVERQRWETSYRQVEQEVLKYQRLLDQELRAVQHIYDFKKLTELHYASFQVANSTHDLFNDAWKTLDAMGRAIVNAAKQRKILEQRKRNAWPWERSQYEREIQSLHKLRDEILIPDKDRVKADRNRLLSEVQRLNKQTAMLRDMIRDRCGSQGVDWYNSRMERTRIRQLNRERAKQGLSPLPLPAEKPRLESKVRGTVKWYDRNRGYGFIALDNGGPDVYVNRKNLSGIAYLNESDRVEFVIRPGSKGQSDWAANVIKLR